VTRWGRKRRRERTAREDGVVRVEEAWLGEGYGGHVELCGSR